MTHQARPAFAGACGPARPRIVLVGEAWGQTEEECHKPFAGESGKELFRMLGEAMPGIEPELHAEICTQHSYGAAWVRRREEWLGAAGIAMTNVLAFRPPGNKLDDLCSLKKEAGNVASTFPPLARGKYLQEQYLPELQRLQQELDLWQPNLVVALGNSACWALLSATNIGSIRGSITAASSGQKVLATYHPAGVLRNWSWRPIVVADLMKAQREGDFPDIRRPKRRVLVSPTQVEMLAWEQETYRLRPGSLSPDIETASGQITCIGFARSPAEAMVIPFWDRKKPGYNYWDTHEDELRAWACVERMLRYDCEKVGQNFIYDLQYLTRMGIQPTRCEADTMLLHHSIFPELQKGLGFLGSIYTNESSWKLLRRRKADSEKKDE